MSVAAGLDPDAQALLAGRPAGPPLAELSVAQARAGFAQSRVALSGVPPDVASVRDLRLPTPAGEIGARLYRPAGTEPQAELPGVVFFHGGGWVLGDLDTHDVTCRQLANAAMCSVLAVDYRRPPEFVFPAAADDAYAATDWFATFAGTLRVDRERIAVMGDSAGGNLAAVTALAARERGGPRLRMQVLVYPVVDLQLAADSFARLAEGFTLTRDAMEWFRSQYAPNEADWNGWRASPLRAENLRDLPPAFVVTAGFDPLCDEGAAYADRLRADGNSVQYRHFAGQMHGFLGAAGAIRAAVPAIEEIGAALRAAWHDYGL
jgi:acetyl esterase